MSFYNAESSYIVSTVEELYEAVEKVKELRRGGIMQPIRILLHGGFYFLTKPLFLDENCFALTIESYAKERATLVGGRRITGFKADTYRGVKCFSAPVPEVKEGKWDFTDLYVDGIPAELTRYPNNKSEWLKMTGSENWDKGSSNWLTVDPSTVSSDLEIDENTWIQFNHLWIDEHAKLTGFDREAGKFSFAVQSRLPICEDEWQDAIVCVQNSPSELKNPNQWYLDRKNGILYYVPENDTQTPENIMVFAPTLEHIAEIYGSSAEKKAINVRLRDLTLTCSRSDYQPMDGGVAYAAYGQAVADATGCIDFRYAKGCGIDDCAVTCFGLYGILVGRGCENIRIADSAVMHGGAGGIRICGASKKEPQVEDYTHHVRVTDSVIAHLGRRYQAGVGVLIMHAASCEVEHCDIHDMYYSGISGGWTWDYSENNTDYMRLCDNLIYNIGQGMLSDMGGIYLLGRQAGSIISGNHIHDVYARLYGAWALYTDQASSYITLENNVCYNTIDYVYHQNFGEMNTVRNNIFAYGGKGGLRITRPEDHLSLVLEHNVMLSDGQPTVDILQKQLDDHRLVVKNSLLWDETRRAYCLIENKEMTLDECEEHGLLENNLVADPGFADPHNADFTLPDDSPAYRTGFKPISVENAGPRNNRYKAD